ncbi:molecular chaperone DnaJ [Citricoccus sp. SGAir0253]|uniref:DnaJ domain-containing protein n=1 Tax=Citricoccus sp. SGAir0253 TaxID=2567881 RepID=UPI0010CCEBB7|nr:DnaJ domain-containing protein [Citricoccus sp. SGAir0253]QCU77739.1 molecular chaperone DnaJ [Citricoccus sp. SGAir0253]
MNANRSGPSAYEILGVAFDADTATLKAAWRRAARRTHPDYGGDAAEFRRVSLAWELVGDPGARRDYDRSFAAAAARSPAEAAPGTGRPPAGARPAARATARAGTAPGPAGARGTVDYDPPLDQAAVLDPLRSAQQVHGAPRRRGLLSSGHRLVREARTIRVLQAHVLSALPAARLVTGLDLRFGRMNSGAIDHVVLCGERLAVIGSLQVPDGAYRWDGAELLLGDRRVSPPSLAPAMVALQRAFPDCTVGGFILVLGPDDNPHAPVIQLDRRRATGTHADFLTDPPGNAVQFGRDVKMFLGAGPDARRVDRRVLARLLGAMY